jgi:heme-degrading monooxygenase HmoA
MVVIVFRSRLRPGAETALQSVGMRMYELASAQPGFVSYKDFAAADGESVAIVEFETLEASWAWRENAEHRLAQQRGRSEFFAEFSVQVCQQVRRASSTDPTPSASA